MPGSGSKRKRAARRRPPSVSPAPRPTPDGEHVDALLDKARASADRLAGLLDDTEQARLDAAHAMARLEQWMRRGATARDEDDAASPDAGGTPHHDLRVSELAAKAERLETAHAVAEAADRAKSCFLAAMSRELRTPVEGLARMIELLQRTELDDEQRRYLGTANHSVCALLGLLDSVLSVSQVDAGVADLRRTDFDLRRALEDAVELLGRTAAGKGLRMKANVRSEVPTILRGDPGRFRQIVLYSLRRAIQFAAHGEITISCRVEAATDTTTTLRFTIGHRDTEIPANELRRAFAPQAHLDRRNAVPGGGRGLSLTIARQILDLMGGRIDLEQYGDRGFTIWFTLPLDRYHQLNDDRRAHGRLPQELLQSSLGPVLDLSMGGMRVECSRPPKGDVDVELLDLEEPVTVRAKVMWTRKAGFRRYEVGLSFPHLPPEVAKQLARVSLNHRLRRLLGI